MIRITWLGHSTFQIQLHSGEVLLFDPWLEGNPSYPSGHKISRADFVLITHGHFDHIANAVEVAGKHGSTVIANYEICMFLKANGVKAISPMNKGGSQAAGSARVFMTHALHSSGIEGSGQIIYGGEAGGYAVELADKRTFYFAGDTDVFSDMALIQELYRPELVFLPIGDLFTMGPRQAELATRLLKPKKVIPMHYETFPPLTGRPEDLATRVGSVAEVWPLTPGETVTW